MKRLAKIKKYTAIGLGVGALALGIPMANADQTINLCAGETTFSPDGGVTEVPMWGFALSTGGVCGTPTVPGPAINATEGEIITINLTNNLAVPVSLIVTGHNIDDGGSNAGPDPTFNGNRVRSLVAEAGATGGTATYVVTAKAGSFIYHSATHQQVQVQMGLYGAMASSPLTPTYGNAITMFYSEIDPALHAAVADGSYGTTGPTSTMVYKPQYFLVNGAPDDGSVAIAAGDTGQDILVRMFNAGLKSRTMQTLGTNMTIVAENGSATPYGKTRITADVHALGTTDVIINSATPGVYRLYDRRLAHSDGATAGGINSTLLITAGAGAPPASDIVAGTNEDTPVLISAIATLPPGSDPASIAVVTDPIHGSATPNGTGSVNYVPNANYNGADSFTYTYEISGVTSAVSTVGITVAAVNDAPVAVADTFDVVVGTPTNLDVLANDTDVEGDSLIVSGTALPLDFIGTITMGTGNQSLDYDPGTAVVGDSTSFTYAVWDGSLPGNGSVTINIVAPPANIAPVAVDETVTWSRSAGQFVDPVTGAPTSTTINILANDSDADGTLDPASVALSLTSKRDKNLANGDQGSSVLLLLSGEVSYTPPSSGGGTDVFTYTVDDNAVPTATSNTATVRINLVK